MSLPTLSDIKTTVLSYIPFDKGNMFMSGTSFSEDATKYTILYRGDVVPYIAPQEYGFIHYISKKKVTVNQYFIQNDTVNALDFLINLATVDEGNKIMAFNKKTVQARNSMMAQGTLQSIKGNVNR